MEAILIDFNSRTGAYTQKVIYFLLQSNVRAGNWDNSTKFISNKVATPYSLTHHSMVKLYIKGFNRRDKSIEKKIWSFHSRNLICQLMLTASVPNLVIFAAEEEVYIKIYPVCDLWQTTDKLKVATTSYSLW